jgi:TPR repeat protein
MWFVIIVLVLVIILWLIGSSRAKADEKADAVAENGTPEQKFRRGQYYMDYDDLKKAKCWFEKAAKQGSSSAMARLKIVELALSKGCKRIKRNGEGAEFHNGAKTLGSVKPEYWTLVGDHYFYGVVFHNRVPYLVDGLKPDMEQAEYWYRQAIGKGMEYCGAVGLYNIAMHYYSKDNADADANRAYGLLLDAAKYGSGDAQAALRKMNDGSDKS